MAECRCEPQLTAAGRLAATVPNLTDIRARGEAALRGVWRAARCGDLTGFATGRSSLTYRCEVEGAPVTSVVLKVAVPGLMPVNNRDVLRQARVLRALAGVPGLRVPRVYAGDEGDPPATPPLFVMQLLAGESFEPAHAASGAVYDADALATREVRGVRMLAALHDVAPADVDLGGEAVVSIRDELAKWSAVFASCGLPGDRKEIEQRVLGRLQDRLPGLLPPVVVHGDWRLGNMQCEADRINGVIDWEIWALGDPRLDLSWFLMWADPVHPLAVNTGMRVPSVVELRAEYEKLRGAVPDLEWFDALARYKQAAACALLVKNARKRGDPDTRFTILDTRIGAMLEASAACL